MLSSMHAHLTGDVSRHDGALGFEETDVVEASLEAFISKSQFYLTSNPKMRRNIVDALLHLDVVNRDAAVSFDKRHVPDVTVLSCQKPNVMWLSPSFREQDSIMRDHLQKRF